MCKDYEYGSRRDLVITTVIAHAAAGSLRTRSMTMQLSPSLGSRVLDLHRESRDGATGSSGSLGRVWQRMIMRPTRPNSSFSSFIPDTSHWRGRPDAQIRMGNNCFGMVFDKAVRGKPGPNSISKVSLRCRTGRVRIMQIGQRSVERPVRCPEAGQTASGQLNPLFVEGPASLVSDGQGRVSGTRLLHAWSQGVRLQ